MSEENVKAVRALFEQWKRGDYSATDWADPNIEFVMNAPGGGTTRGFEEMREAWREFLRAWENFRGTPKEILAAGDKVVVLNEFGGEGHESGAPLRGLQGAVLFTFRQAKVVRLELFSGNWDEALEAVGLSADDISSRP